MDESAFWVGPVHEPARYRLTHLLGSGGEGEVWRAVRSGDEHCEVAVKIDAVPADRDDGWEQRLDDLATLRVSGLVDVQEAFVGTARHRADDERDGEPTHRYVVMNHVEGLTLRTWLDEHPEASARRRIRILRGVAATLSRLHRGPDGKAPITHGDVKPTNIIIGPDGTPVLVDLGLLRPAGTGPVSGRTAAYSSPELRNPDGRPGPRADTFSFAVTAMEALTALTPPLSVDGSLDLEATRTRVATASALRFRPMLRRQLLRSLTPEPESRPATPVRVFAGRTLVLTAVPLVLVLGAGGSAIAVRADAGAPVALVTAARAPSSPSASVSVDAPVATGPASTMPTTPSSQPAKAGPSATPTPTATPTATTSAAPIHVVDTGTILHGALIGGTDPLVHSNCGTRSGSVVTNPTHPLTTWGSGQFTLTLSSDRALKVLSVKRKPVKASAPTSLLQDVGLTCPVTGGPIVSPPVQNVCPGGTAPYRTYTRYLADADRGSWQEASTRDHRPFGVLDYRCFRSSQIDLVTDDCRTNVDYQVSVTFQVDGDPTHIYRRTFPPIHLRARVTHGTFVTSLEGLFDYPFPFSGGPDGCARQGVKVTRPYRSVTDGIYVMLVDKIAQARRKNPALTTAQAIDGLIRALEQGGTRTVPSPYTAADLANVCRQAQADPARWRGTCGPPDGS